MGLNILYPTDYNLPQFGEHKVCIPKYVFNGIIFFPLCVHLHTIKKRRLLISHLLWWKREKGLLLCIGKALTIEDTYAITCPALSGGNCLSSSLHL